MNSPEVGSILRVTQLTDGEDLDRPLTFWCRSDHPDMETRIPTERVLGGLLVVFLGAGVNDDWKVMIRGDEDYYFSLDYSDFVPLSPLEELALSAE